MSGAPFTKPSRQRRLVLGRVVRLLLLLTLLGNGGAQDVAEAGTGLRGAVLSHGLLLFLDLELLDRQGDTAGLAIHRSDLGVNLFARGIAVRTLFTALP